MVTGNTHISVVLCTHNPDSRRLRRTLDGIRAQTWPAADRETVVVDNGSEPPISSDVFGAASADRNRIVPEPTLGLSTARRTGMLAARGDLLVLVDDDNVLAADYLAQVAAIFAREPTLGTIGGRSSPEFECEPPLWAREFLPLLALRDLGPAPLLAPPFRADSDAPGSYPVCAPIGAGMALRRQAADAWIKRGVAPGLDDRRGAALTSAGDNDLVLCALRAGWGTGYFPELSLTHLIPAARLGAGYLARLNRGIQESWMRVLSHHGVNPWPPIPAWSLRPRQWRAWLRHRAWVGPAEHIRWSGACGHFAGRVARNDAEKP